VSGDRYAPQRGGSKRNHCWLKSVGRKNKVGPLETREKVVGGTGKEGGGGVQVAPPDGSHKKGGMLGHPCGGGG